MASLRRTWVGPHAVEKAVPLDALTDPDAVKANLVPMDRALDLPSVVVRSGRRKAVLSGAILGRKALHGDCPVRTGWVQVKTESGALLALGLVQPSAADLCIHPKRVLTD